MVVLCTRTLLLFLLISLASVLTVRFVDPPVSMIMLTDRDRKPNGPWLPITRIPAHVQMAVIASEDQRFADHSGFDFQELENALAAARKGEGLRGASTLSQQTAKNLFLWHGRSLARKAIEAVFTVEIELLWPKERILEVYLNIAEFGPSIYGVAAGAHHHFGVPVDQLTPRQAALLASLLPAPKSYQANPPDPHVLERAQWIEKQIRQLGGDAYLARLRHQPKP